MTRWDIVRFDWDKWNIDKSYQRHGITPNEAEEVFLDENVQIVPDLVHSETEERLIAIGKTGENILFVVFTQRERKVRIISARRANKKERSVYEKKVKANS